MPITKNAFKRFVIIDQVLRDKQHPPTLKRMQEVCGAQKIEVSLETLSKDIRDMRKEMQVPIKFNPSTQKYYYSDDQFSLRGVRLTTEETKVLQESLTLIRCLLKTELGNKLRHAMEKVLSNSFEAETKTARIPILKTMEPPESRGYDHMDMLLDACKERIPVSFIHYSYTKEVFNSVLFHPCVVREFDNRWYIFGFSETHQAARCFGLDRIYAPKFVDKFFRNTEAASLENFLDHMYGVYPLPESVKEEVMLHSSPFVTKMLNANPIHASQKVTKHRNGTGRISLNLIPTMELVQFIRSYGRDLQIIAPRWLAAYEMQTR